MAHAGGRGAPYYIVQRLSWAIIHHWAYFNGWALGHGIHPRELEATDLMDLAIYWMTRNLSAEELAKWELDIWQPPTVDYADIPVESPWSAESEMEAFSQMAAALAGAVPPAE